MLKKVIIGLVVVVVALVLVGFLLPAEATVERSVVINAPASEIYPHLCDFEKTQAWSPWSERDPDIENAYEGTACTVGHKHLWKSDVDGVGNGTQEVAAVTPDERVDTTLDFGEHGLADAYFTLVPEGEGTKVTWGFRSDMGNNPIGRWMGLMMDGFIGGDYEKGLGKLKATVEKG